MIKTIKSKWWTVFFLLFLVALVQPGLYAEETNEDSPIKVTLQNNSDQSVLVHVLAYDMIEATHSLEPGKVLELETLVGNRLRLEYAPSPHESLLSPLGSLNETNRTVSIRNDGKYIFIEEKISGQRVKGKGENRIQPRTISDPQLELENKKAGSDGGRSTTAGLKTGVQNVATSKKSLKIKKAPRKEDPAQPEKKNKKENK